MHLSISQKALEGQTHMLLPTTGKNHYMWVYRTGKMTSDKRIILYEYQSSRNASHPRNFLKNFQGICLTDGYQVYHTIEKGRENLKIVGCLEV